MKFDDYSMNEILLPLLLPDELSLYPIYATIPRIQINRRFDSSNVAYVTYTNFDRLIIVKLESLTMARGAIEIYRLSDAERKTHEIKRFGIYSGFLRFRENENVIRFNIEASPTSYKNAFPNQAKNVRSLFSLFSDNYDEDDMFDFFAIPEISDVDNTEVNADEERSDYEYDKNNTHYYYHNFSGGEINDDNNEYSYDNDLYYDNADIEMKLEEL